jgi:hypothetical protein
MGDRRVLFILAGFLIITFFMTGAPVAAAVVTIDNSQSIQIAIDNLVASPDLTDTLVLNPGTYAEYDIVIKKNITIQANTSYGHDASDTVIDAMKLGRIFDSSADHDLTIDNLTMRNTSYNRFYEGGAIKVGDGGSLTVTSSAFTGCSVLSYGGAISVTSGTLTVTSTTFTDCYSSLGGAIYAGASTVLITASTFTRCSGIEGGAIANTGTLTVTSSEFISCTVTQDVDGEAKGGAIANSGTLTVTSSTFTDCSAQNAHYVSTGGAIFNRGTATISSSTFNNCHTGTGAYDLGGGAISNDFGGTLSVTSSSFNGCSAVVGGAIDNWESTLTLTGTTFSGCSASRYGGAINSAGAPGFAVASSSFTGCTATTGGGAIAVSGSGAPSILSSDFDSCSAGSDGGGAVLSFPATTIHFSRFHGNTASGSGTAVRFVSSSSTATNNWWSSNSGPGAAYSGNPAAVASWLVLGITADPASIGIADTSAIRTNLTFDSDGGAHPPAGGHVPDNIINTFAMVSGSGSVSPLTDGTVNGVVQTTFTPLYGETVNISGTVDDQTVYIELPVTWPAPAVTGITPNTGFNVSDIAITNLAGLGFLGGAEVRLVRAGHANITATGVTVVSPSQITCTLPITHAEAGAWDVVVVNPDGQEGVLPGGFTIRIAGPGPTAPVPTLDTSGNDDGFPSLSNPLMTVTVNIGGDSKAWQAVVTGTGLKDLIVTGIVQHGAGDNVTAPPGIVYQYISLVPVRFTGISKAVIHFTVPQEWLDENHIDPKSIVLYHQTANGWEALPTSMLSMKDGTVYFSAQSTGFSLFAIAGTPTVATPPGIAATREIVSTPVQEKAPVPAAVVKTPVATQTTAPPAASPQPAAPSPLLNIVLVIAAIGILAGGGFMARRWWIQRQNPALFREHD